jgi:DNA-binding winged helix-turn-helix (wHTH) protein
MGAVGSGAIYRFDRFVLDPSRGVLLSAEGQEIALRPKAFRLLRLLVENPGRLLNRDTIMQAVWSDVIISDDGITQCVRDIRRALADDAQRIVKTVPRRGYNLAAECGCVPTISVRGKPISEDYGTSDEQIRRTLSKLVSFSNVPSPSIPPSHLHMAQ